MSVLRKQNWLGQQRVDIPHIRSIEDSICADFDVLAGRMMAGSAPLVIRGFDTVTSSAIGQPASNLQVNVANASVMHQLASESGTIFWVPSTRAIEILNAANTRLRGSFTASSTNYIGIDLLRSSDSNTADLVQFINPLSNLEAPKDVPLGRTLDYVIYVSTQDFSTTPNICPIAIVVTDSSNNVSSITDARNLFFRLGNGGSNPNSLSTYSWPGGRTEVGNNSDFAAGDKLIRSFSDWTDSVMTRLWELGGGERWYSPTADRNVQLLRNGTSVFVSTGDYFEWTGTNLHWKSLRMTFDNSTGSFNDIADQLADNPNQTDLADGQCVYVDIDRTTNRTGGTALVAVKGTTATLGTPLIPGSRYIIAWRIGSNIFTRGNSYYVGAQFVVATTSAVGVVKLHQASLTPATPVVVSDGDFNTANGIPQFDANRALTIAVPTGGGNTTALTATGLGSGSGVSAIGGGTQGRGVSATGGGTTGVGINAIGANNVGVGSGIGGNFAGGTNSGTTGETGTSGAGVVAKGPATGYGPGIVTQTNGTTNIAAQYRAQSSDGLARATHDYLGFRSGWLDERMSNFWGMPQHSTGVQSGVATDGWSITCTTNVRTGFYGPIEGAQLGSPWPRGAMVLQLQSARTNTDNVFMRSPYWINMSTSAPYGAVSNNMIWVMEWTMGFGYGLASFDLFAGFSSSPGAPFANNAGVGVRFKQSASESDTTFKFIAANGTSTTANNTGVTPTFNAAGSIHRFRLELHSVNSPFGQCARLFVDGTPQTTITTNLPVGSLVADLACVFFMQSTATPGVGVELEIGPCRTNTFVLNGLTGGPTTSDV